jgi:hypothetical protein
MATAHSHSLSVRIDHEPGGAATLRGMAVIGAMLYSPPPAAIPVSGNYVQDLTGLHVF